MGVHLIEDEFQSDKFPETPRGLCPLSPGDPMAQDLLWEYARRRRKVDKEFSEDLEDALSLKGYVDDGISSSEYLKERNRVLQNLVASWRTDCWNAQGQAQDSRDELGAVRMELKRFKRGEFTAEEIHTFCHNLPDTVSREEFEAGCKDYINGLYGIGSKG